MMPDLSGYIGDIAQKLLGTPNEALSTRVQLRFGNNGSVAVEIRGPQRGQWYDHEDQIGGGPWEMLRIKGGLDNEHAKEWLRDNLGLEIKPETNAGDSSQHQRQKRHIVKSYYYHDEAGLMLFRVDRWGPKKTFSQHAPDGHGGWTKGKGAMKGVRLVPYRLPHIVAAKATGNGTPWRVYIVEGEKDVDNMVLRLGVTATTNPMGAGKWSPEFNRHFAGSDAVIIADNDNVGRVHAAAIAAHLTTVASIVRVVELGGLDEHGDISNWIEAGGTQSELDALVKLTPTFRPTQTEEGRPPAYSDDALALRFSERHGAELRYVATWGEWFLWDDTHWEPDDTLRAFDLARAECRRASAELLPQKRPLAAQVASAKAAAAVERLAKSDRRHASTTDSWDSDLWLLNTPTGTVDLRSGCSRPHRRDDFITKTTTVGCGDGCLRWLEFLQQITARNRELLLYLQRVAGYVLTGSTREHALFFLYGTGANGKSTFVNTLLWLLGGYAASAPMETFTASQFDRHPTELAGLRGARLVVSIETEEGRRWAESRIKALTGGEPIRARFMRQDFFEFTPRFKLMVAGNHKPVLRNVDRAMRRRMNLIPFTVEIPKLEQDEELPEKLRSEGPGILSWAIEGCAEWQRVGLAPPAAVIEATEEYLSGEDSIALWIDECCSQSSMSQTITAELYASWCKWSERTGEQPGSMKRFSQVLEDRGYAKCRVGHESRMGFKGLAVRQEDMSERYWNR